MTFAEQGMIIMSDRDKTKLQVVIGAEGYGSPDYYELRNELLDCPDIETAVGVCVDENYRSLAGAIRRAAGLDKSVGAWGTVTYHLVITDEEADYLHAWNQALDMKDDLNPAPFEDEIRDINKNHEPALESLMRKLVRK